MYWLVTIAPRNGERIIKNAVRAYSIEEALDLAIETWGDLGSIIGIGLSTVQNVLIVPPEDLEQ